MWCWVTKNAKVNAKEWIHAVRKEEDKVLYCCSSTTRDWQPEHKHEYDRPQYDGKAKRWSHLRIIRVVVPSGKSAGKGGGKKKSRKIRDVRWKQCQLRAECIDYSENEKPSSRGGGHMTHASNSSRCWQTQAEKCVFLSIECALQGLDHVDSCHSKFSNQFSKEEIHGGLW